MIYAVTYGTHLYMHHKSWAGVGEVEAKANHLTLLPRGSTGKVNRGLWCTLLCQWIWVYLPQVSFQIQVS